MSSKKRYLLFPFVLFLVVSILFFVQKDGIASENEEALFSPSDLIRGINAYRAENGLYSMGTNSRLAAAAQAQADYQSSLGYWTHTGADGSSPMDRAYAYGYGDGKKIFATEITYCGSNGSIDTAIGWWKTSAVHNSYMLTNQYVEMGAGQASGNANCFTVVMGWITGVVAPSVDSAVGDDNSSEGAIAQDGTEIQQQLIIPVTKADPKDDGSIVHVVMPGQAMWNIWALYSEDYPELTIEMLYEMNELSVWDFLIEGAELLIHEGQGGVNENDQTPNGSENDDVTPEPLDVATAGPMVSPTPVPTITLMAIGDGPAEKPTEVAIVDVPTTNQNAGGFFANFTLLHWILVGVFGLMSVLIVIAFLTDHDD